MILIGFSGQAWASDEQASNNAPSAKRQDANPAAFMDISSVFSTRRSVLQTI
jgi:hypothetical protein